MNVPPTEQHPIPEDIRVFWLNFYECWAARSLDEAIEASMKEFGVTREEAYPDDGDSYEIPRDDWDTIKCPNDPDEVIFYEKGPGRRGVTEIDWEKTSYETIRQSVASHGTFPVMIGGRE